MDKKLKFCEAVRRAGGSAFVNEEGRIILHHSKRKTKEIDKIIERYWLVPLPQI